nr:unnamed protein product [Digitaria exilis]
MPSDGAGGERLRGRVADHVHRRAPVAGREGRVVRYDSYQSAFATALEAGPPARPDIAARIQIEQLIRNPWMLIFLF